MTRGFLCIDEAVGETRRCLVDRQGRPFRLDVERWSERSCRVKLGEKRWIRALARLGGAETDWFATSDGADKGVLKLGPKDRVTEGQLVPAIVAAEAFADKGPRYRLDPDTDVLDASRPDRPGLRDAQAAGDPFLDGVEIVGSTAGAKAREVIDAAIEEGLQTIIPLPGGGDIAIEPTRALTAVDIDAGGNPAGKSFPELNKVAANEIARQLGLRATAGLVVIDFINMHLREDRMRVADVFRSALTTWGVHFKHVAPITQFGLCDAVISRRRRPLADAVRAPDGEREALDGLRMIESAALAETGKRIRARIGQGAERWLASRVIDWEAALADRIGRRWTIEPGVEPRCGRPDVWAES